MKNYRLILLVIVVIGFFIGFSYSYIPLQAVKKEASKMQYTKDDLNNCAYNPVEEEINKKYKNSKPPRKIVLEKNIFDIKCKTLFQRYLNGDNPLGVKNSELNNNLIEKLKQKV